LRLSSLCLKIGGGEQIHAANNPLDALIQICDLAQVSMQAAQIKFIDCLPPDYVIASSIGGIVDWSSRSAGSLAATVRSGTDLRLDDPYPFPCDRTTVRLTDGWRRGTPGVLRLSGPKWVVST
jgi:hypothetical protein